MKKKANRQNKTLQMKQEAEEYDFKSNLLEEYADKFGIAIPLF